MTTQTGRWGDYTPGPWVNGHPLCWGCSRRTEAAMTTQTGRDDDGFRQIRLRWVWLSRYQGHWIVWVCLFGRKPLAHLPMWRQRLHPPAIRWLVWKGGE